AACAAEPTAWTGQAAREPAVVLRAAPAWPPEPKARAVRAATKPAVVLRAAPAASGQAAAPRPRPKPRVPPANGPAADRPPTAAARPPAAWPRPGRLSGPP